MWRDILIVLGVLLVLAGAAEAIRGRPGDRRPRLATSETSGTDFTADSDALGCWLLFSNGTETGAEADRCAAGGTNTMTYTGTFAAGASTPAGTASDQDSVELDGTSERFHLADDNAFEATDFTLGGWFNPDDNDSAYIIMTKNDTDNYEIIRGGATNMSYEVVTLNEAGSTNAADATWSHVVLRYSSTTDEVEPFYNGSADCTGGCRAQTTAPDGTGTDNLTIGADVNGTSSELPGDIMEWFYFDRTLTNAEIAEIFLCGMDGTADGTARDAALVGAQCSDITTCC